MTAPLIGIIGIVVLILVFCSGMPIGFAMAIVGFLGLCIIGSVDAAFTFLSADLWNTFSTYTLTVIPMFVLMGSITFNAGVTRSLYSTAYSIVGHFRGGLALATVGACALFSAVCGSSSATAAAMAKIALPEMDRHGYDTTLSCGSIAAGGSLGILIPPSTAFIILGLLMEQSVNKLFIAGIFPGILLTVLFMLVIYVLCRWKPTMGMAGPKFSWKNRIISITGSLDMIILFLVVMGGLFAGIFTPTEAGAAGAGGALVITLARRKINWQGIRNSVFETVAVTSMIFVILAAAIIFGHFIAYTGLSSQIIEWLTVAKLSPYAVMWIIVAGYAIAGCFMDSLPLTTLTVPILYPIILHLGFSPIWFGVIQVITGELGIITPPVGMNLYVIKGVDPNIPLHKLYMGALPFIPAYLVCIALIMYLPQIALFLPNLMK
jgi:C4-dicarboxylate transporter, DctM subunit